VIISDLSQPAPSAGPWKLLGVINRRKVILASTVALGLAAGYAGYSNAPSRYTSDAVLVLDVRRVQALPSESIISPLPQDSPVIRTELDIIKSRTMAENVIGVLGAETTREGGRLPTVGEKKDLRLNTKAVEPMDIAKAATRPPDANPALVDQLLDNLSVVNDGRSYTIFLSYAADNPARAANIVNAFADAYLDYQVEVKQAATKQVGEWLGQKLVSLLATLEKSERTLSEFRREQQLVEGNGTTMQAQRVSALDAELVSSRANLAAARARLDSAKDVSDDKSGPAIAEVLNAQNIQTLRTEKDRLERSIKEILDDGATKSNLLPALNSQLSSLDAQIDVATKRVVQGLSTEVEIARRRLENIEGALGGAQAELDKANKALVQEAQLEREASANRAIYESYLSRYKQTIEQDGISVPEARIISRAEPAGARSSPNLMNWLLLGAVWGGMAGFAGAIFREATDRRIRSASSLESATGYPVIGMIPMAPRGAKTGAEGQHGRALAFSEAFVSLQTVLQLSTPSDENQVIAVTSSQAGEGKTTVAVNLARAMSRSTLKTLVIDCDFRMPSVAGAFQAVPAENIEAALVGNRSIDSAIWVDPATGVNILSGRIGISPGLLLADRSFRKTIQELRSRYDVILLDAPDLSDFAETLQTTSFADTVLLVANKERTSTDTLRGALERLAGFGKKPLGIVLNRDSSSPDFLRPFVFESRRDVSPAPQNAADKVYPFPKLEQAKTGV
jgi:capsular exopolysaccharide synthesis family protein